MALVTLHPLSPSHPAPRRNLVGKKKSKRKKTAKITNEKNKEKNAASMRYCMGSSFGVFHSSSNSPPPPFPFVRPPYYPPTPWWEEGCVCTERGGRGAATWKSRVPLQLAIGSTRCPLRLNKKREVKEQRPESQEENKQLLLPLCLQRKGVRCTCRPPHSLCLPPPPQKQRRAIESETNAE